MTTTTVKTIGTTARDYSTIASWWAACPADLVTSDEIWQGECYNDSEFLVTSATTFSGVTTSSTQFPRLTAASGESFADNANKLTNALRYNQSNGVGIRTATGYVNMLTVSVSHIDMSKLQVYRQSDSGTNLTITNTSVSGGSYEQMIVQSDTTKIQVMSLRNGTDNTISNSLIVCRGNGANGNGIDAGYPGTGSGIFNCTIVKPSDQGGNGLGIKNNGGGFSNLVVKNTAVFGWGTTASAGTYNASSDYNAVPDATSPFGGANDQTSAVYADQFKVVTNATMDFRAFDAA